MNRHLYLRRHAQLHEPHPRLREATLDLHPGGFERFFYEAGLVANAGRTIREISATDQSLAREVAAKYGSIQEGN